MARSALGSVLSRSLFAAVSLFLCVLPAVALVGVNPLTSSLLRCLSGSLGTPTRSRQWNSWGSVVNDTGTGYTLHTRPGYMHGLRTGAERATMGQYCARTDTGTHVTNVLEPLAWPVARHRPADGNKPTQWPPSQSLQYTHTSPEWTHRQPGKC